jgi:toxin ParE1/3/4
MLDITKDIQSLTTFRRRSGDLMKQLKKSRRPVVLTVNGKAAAVVQDAQATRDCSTSRPAPISGRGFARAWKTRERAGRVPLRSSSRNSKPSMAYLVSMALRAQRDLISLYEDINAKESAAALRWYQSLKLAILGLEENPNRCPITPESKQIRHLLYGHKPHVYRVISRVLERKKRVDILHIHIRYGAQRKFKIRNL